MPRAKNQFLVINEPALSTASFLSSAPNYQTWRPSTAELESRNDSCKEVRHVGTWHECAHTWRICGKMRRLWQPCLPPPISELRGGRRRPSFKL
ncbi:hypothetical protein JTE90_008011 [Oedothorax gibbosus]|uniref:Uncharacterized protein n=1 Tax=Oedothorax gibbosus TaxID=931172 RepID=A0AAV6UW91_9ARAC|nr:hypothetical protein JTE90_008011 [Oedothorax gibbosus]